MWIKQKRQGSKPQTLSYYAVTSCIFALLSVNPLPFFYDKLPDFYINFLTALLGTPLKISLLLVPAIALGHVARGDIRFNKGLRGKWLANIGLVVAYFKVICVIVALTLHPSLLYIHFS